MRHLAEEDVQTYLDRPEGALDAGLLDHIKVCSQCRRALADYRTLYAGLADDTAFEIPRGLAGAVISRLGLKQTRRRFRVPGDLVLVACAIVAMLIGASLFADMRPILDTGSAVAGAALDFRASLLESAYSRTAAIFMTGVFVLGLSGLLDAVFRLKRSAAIGRQMR